MRAKEFLSEKAKAALPMPGVTPGVGEPETDPLYGLKLAIANKIKVMTPDDETQKALHEIEDLLSHVGAGGKKGHISTELQAIEDKDVHRARSLLAKYIHSLDMTPDQRADLFTRWKKDQLVDRKTLLSTGKHSIPEIIIGYDDPRNPAIKELTDDLSQVATLGQGKGEFLLSVFSKNITKLHKGDLQIDGHQIEVKTQDVGGGRFYDQEVRPAQGYAASVQQFLKTWGPDINAVFGKSASSGLKLIDMMTLSDNLDPAKKKSYWTSVTKVFQEIFPGMDVGSIVKAMQVGNIGAAKQNYAITNLDFYRGIKKDDAGILFIDLSKPVAEFVFFRDASELKAGGLRLHANTVYPITTDPRNAYPQMRIMTTKAVDTGDDETGMPVQKKPAKVAKPAVKSAPTANKPPVAQPTPGIANQNATMAVSKQPMGQAPVEPTPAI